MRAADISNTPVFYAYALVTRSNGVWLFLHENRSTPELEKHFTDEGVTDLKIGSYLDVTDSVKNFVSQSF